MSSLLRTIKKWENGVWRRGTARLLAVAARGCGFCVRVARAGSQEITILVVPHSEKPSRGIRLPLFGFVGLCALCLSLVVGALFFLFGVHGDEGKLSDSNSTYSVVKSERDQLQDQMTLFMKAYKAFKGALDAETAALGRKGTASLAGAAGFPFAPKALFPSRLTALQEIEEARATLDQARTPIEEYGTAIAEMNDIKPTVPAVWPIKDDAGHISFPFGPEPNPFTGEMYFHTGIDASTYRTGDPIVATADGTVVFAGVDGGYGRCVFIMHAHGYYTRYGHMERILVSSGQKVKQGQIIGLIGMTGVATGPHVHYEVILGSSYVDPLGYLWSDSRLNPIISGGTDHD